MIGPEQLAAGERAEIAGDFVAAAAAYGAVAGLADHALAAEAYFRLGRATWRQGRYEPAVRAFESALALAEGSGDVELQARVHNGIGVVHYARGAYAEARRAYHRAQGMTKDPAMRGKIVLNLGVIENIEGNYAGARAFYEEAWRLFDAAGDTASAMLALHNRGMVEADLHRWADADVSFLAALTLATESGNREMIAKTLVNRSEVLVATGALDEAVDHCDRALEIYAVVGDEVGRGEALRWRAHALGRRGAAAEAEPDAMEALQIAVRSGARLLEAEAARDLGVLRGMLGDRVGATKELRRALALFTELGARHDVRALTTLLAQAEPVVTFASSLPATGADAAGQAGAA